MSDNKDSPLDMARIVLELLDVANRMSKITAEVMAAYNPEANKPKFVPNPVQKELLKHLKGKGCRTDELALVAGGKSRLFPQSGTGGLPELQEEGLVGHHPRVGFYSVASPPPDLAE